MASNPEQNVELARGGLENWISGDREATISSFTEDVEVYVPPELGNAGTYRGVEQFKRWFQAWDEVWTDYRMSVESIEPAGDRHVLAMVHSRATGVGSGVEVENLLAWVIGVRDERMDFLSLQPDRAHALELARERESAD
ncbi:MAG: nuclear transport factor 2 family protein [Solirubrobacterales bacterium]